jgi:hypothetical protein
LPLPRQRCARPRKITCTWSADFGSHCQSQSQSHCILFSLHHSCSATPSSEDSIEAGSSFLRKLERRSQEMDCRLFGPGRSVEPHSRLILPLRPLGRNCPSWVRLPPSWNRQNYLTREEETLITRKHTVLIREPGLRNEFCWPVRASRKLILQVPSRPHIQHLSKRKE